MMKRKLLVIILSVLLATLISTVYVCADAPAIELRVTNSEKTTEATPINMTGIMPGDKSEFKYTINLTYHSDVKMNLSAKLSDDFSENLKKELQVVATVDGQKMFEGSFAEFAEGKYLFIEKDNSNNTLIGCKAEIPLSLTFSLPQTAGNEVKDCNGKCDLIIEGLQEDIPTNTDAPIIKPPKTGDYGAPQILIGLFMATVMILGAYVYKKGCKKHESKE